MSRAAEYRERAADARAKATATTDPDTRKTLEQDVDTWERMANWEEATHLPAGGDEYAD